MCRRFGSGRAGPWWGCAPGAEREGARGSPPRVQDGPRPGRGRAPKARLEPVEKVLTGHTPDVVQDGFCGTGSHRLGNRRAMPTWRCQGVTSSGREVEVSEEPQPQQKGVPYLRLSDKASTTLTRSTSLLAWSGSVDSLRRVEALIEDQLEPLFLAEVAGLGNSMEDRLHISDLRDRYALSVDVVAEGGLLTRTGSVRQILAEMESRHVDSIQMESGSWAGSHTSRVKLVLSRTPTKGGPVELLVSGADRVWVAGTYDLLLSELRRNVPKWGVMRSPWVAALGTVFLILGIFGAMRRLVPESSTSGTYILLLALSPLLWLPIQRFLHWAFPGFEVLRIGEESTGRKVGAVLYGAVSLLLAVAGLLLALK